MPNTPRFRDAHGRIWEDRDGPVLLTPDPGEYPDWIDTAARTAVTDVDDLIEDLRRAGYTLPNPTEHPKEN